MSAARPSIRSLICNTDIDVLPASSVVEDRGDHVVVRTPSNPAFHWGNFIMWRTAPGAGDRERWEAVFDAEFPVDRPEQHYAFCWDSIDGEEGVAREEFVDAAGYEGELVAALVAGPHELFAHARASREVAIRALDPAGDEALWGAVVELQVSMRDAGHPDEDRFRAFARERLADRREHFRAGGGAWFAALTASGELVASCGVVVTEGRGRFQVVDTAEAYRRRGIATRLVHDAGRAAIDDHGAHQLVIVADVNYHAKALYESLGFVERERAFQVSWWPEAPNAARRTL